MLAKTTVNFNVIVDSPARNRQRKQPAAAHTCRERPSTTGQEEVSDTNRLAFAIARSGAAGVSRDGLRRVVRLSPEAWEDLLRASVAAGQVVIMQAGEQRTYRAAT